MTDFGTTAELKTVPKPNLDPRFDQLNVDLARMANGAEYFLIPNSFLRQTEPELNARIVIEDIASGEAPPLVLNTKQPQTAQDILMLSSSALNNNDLPGIVASAIMCQADPALAVQLNRLFLEKSEGLPCLASFLKTIALSAHINFRQDPSKIPLALNFVGTDVSPQKDIPVDTTVQLEHSPDHFVYTKAKGANLYTSGGVDVGSSQDKRVLCLCTKQTESNLETISEDCVGFSELDDTKVLLVQADGVGSSISAELAARTAIRVVCQSGTVDLATNLAQAGRAVQALHPSLRAYDVTNGMLPNLQKRREKELADKATGSQTMLNQALVDKQTGQVSVLNLGDGYCGVIKPDGQIQLTTFTRNGELGSNFASGARGQPSAFSFALESGDTFFMCSDGVTRDGNMANLEAIRSELASGQVPVKNALSNNPAGIIDDKGIVLYVQT